MDEFSFVEISRSKKLISPNTSVLADLFTIANGTFQTLMQIFVKDVVKKIVFMFSYPQSF
jgi:hypothetical protein